MGLSAGFAGSFSFSLVRLRAGVVDGAGAPKETGSLAPKEKVDLAAAPLLFDPKAITAGLAGSAEVVSFGMGWMVRPEPKPYAGGG